jgi:hypothetical protein
VLRRLNVWQDSSNLKFVSQNGKLVFKFFSFSGIDVLKLFTVVTNTVALQAGVLVSANCFNPSLIFVMKVAAGGLNCKNILMIVSDNRK